jgi:hypothetical protein
MCREINHLVVDGVEDVWGVDVEALGRELVRMGAQECGQLLPAIARPNVPHRARATVAAAKKPRSLSYLLAAAPTPPPLFHRHFISRKNGTWRRIMMHLYGQQTCIAAKPAKGLHL